MSASNHTEQDAIEQLVAQYLTSEAHHIDGRKLLDRARKTRRRHVTWRRIGIVFATAATVILAVTLGIITAPGQSTQPDIPQIIRPIAAGGSAISNSFTTAHASFTSIRQSVAELHYPVTAPSRSDIQPLVAQFQTTWKNDAAYMSGKLRTSISNVVANAGLAL